MRLFVFFDLPTETQEDRRHYNQFRRGLIKNGFLMMQESVYCRMLVSPSAEKATVEAIRRIRPPKGLVQVLMVTEKQFSRMVFLTGESNSNVIDSDERLIFL